MTIAQADGALVEAELLLAAITELRERLESRSLSADARREIAEALLEQTSRLLAFTMKVAA